MSQPLYILNMGPDDGALAAAVLAALRDEMHACGMLGWPVRYVLCPKAGEEPALALLRQPALQPFVARGWLDQASWQARRGHPLLLGANRFALFGSRNPVVAMTAGGFSALQAELYGVHYGELLQARIQAQAVSGDRFALACEWRTLAEGEIGSAMSALLDHYRSSLINATVLLSNSALSLLDALADFSAGRYLLLAADQGVADERQIRLNCMALPEQLAPGELGLPVNFHALGMHQESAGAHVAHLEWGASGSIQHMACRDDAIGMDAASWSSLVETVDEDHPAERWWHGAPHSPVESVDEINFRLRCSGHDPWALQSILDSLDLRLLDAADEGALQTLHRSLARTWQQMTQRQRCDAGLGLAGLLVHVGQWALARDVLAEIPDGDSPAAFRIDQLLLRARLEAQTGRSATALRVVRECLRLDAGHPEAQGMHELLDRRLVSWQANNWYEADAMRDDELSLEPLDALHIPAWLHQYRDPNIAVVAGLPPITCEAEAQTYLAHVGGRDGTEYAVVHRNFGFVGAIGLRREADMAHIHFWIGVEHQGTGFGARAVRLLTASLAGGPVRHLFTSVHEGNTRSHRLLEKAGFDALGHESLGDDVGYRFMHLALPGALACTNDELEHRLAAVCECIGEPLAR
ncbi:GNAT family N-acetyltransferase [Polaromonas aquatica]|uniref:GNAT family N-acetyltransferase n=1 Tax=Polaromonas aquatica TaxID=332657 RepID=UPI003D64FD55